MHRSRPLLKSAFNKLIRMASHFNSVEESMEEIGKRLSKHAGGSVELVKREDGLALVLLNNEKKKNAMSGKMMVDLHDVVEELSRWDVGKGVIIRGKSGNFCSGGDLEFVKQVATPEEGFMMSTYMQTVLNKFQRLPLISVAVIEGIGALGGGWELSVACDFILMKENCSGIGFVHAKMGLIPAWGGANRLIEKLGYTKALDLMSSAEFLNPKQCVQIGLVNDIIPAKEASDAYAISWLQKRVQFDSRLTRGIKTCLSSARDLPRDYERERRLFAPFWGGPAHVAALQSNKKLKPDS